MLHKLCYLLSMQGYDAKICAYYQDKMVKFGKEYPCPYPVESVRTDDIKGRIVIYPEIIPGNPLNSDKVVRWFLHKPGYHTNEIKFGENELYFYYKPKFNDPSINPHPENVLKIFDIKEDVYQNLEREDRQGFCYLVRKGKDRELNYHPRGSIKIDGLTHKEVAEIFNRCEGLQRQ